MATHETFPKTYFLTRRREPKHFMLWLSLSSTTFVFTILLAAYSIRRIATDWEDMPMPLVFLASTVVILTSSMTLHMAAKALQHERFAQYRFYMGATLFIGIVFIILQLLGWQELVLRGVYLQSNPSGSFLYLLSGLHLLHSLVGVFFLFIAFMEAIRRMRYVDFFVYSVNPPNRLRIQLISLYWHFVDMLWLCVFLFLLFHHGIDFY